MAAGGSAIRDRVRTHGGIAHLAPRPATQNGHAHAPPRTLAAQIDLEADGLAAAVSANDLRAKRALDVVLSTILLVDLLPVFGLCALAIRLESRGPVLFRQQRIGQDGQPFTMLKFRSMYVDADARAHQAFVTSFIRGTAEGQPTGDGQVYKLVRDSRVTRVGRWLRKTSLDELPQLINVLRGEMSLVGPRPPLPYEVAQYTPADLRRLAARPGITGLWQVSGRSKTTFAEMVALDLAYIRTRSLRTDLAILLKTIPVVFEGAY
jgi:lipopolysaccharide/colanic/teichoic acid biosynthesis glycosyltransferase